MLEQDFSDLAVDVLDQVRAILVSKNVEYARGEDKLHNFKRAAALLQCSSVESCKGMMAKHTVSIYDFIDDFEKGTRHPRTLWLEKVVDQIAYLILLLGLLEDAKGFQGELT